MKIAYFDCFSGISGDMTLGALIDAGLDINILSKELKKLGLKGYELKKSKTLRQGISGTKFDIIIKGDLKQHSHRSLSEILKLIDRSPLKDNIKETAKAIFNNIGKAEAKVHGISDKKELNLHELGDIDSILDIVGVSIALDTLGIERVYSSSVSFGRTFIPTKHGILPTPSPASIELLKGVPSRVSDIEGELVTPTGAGILKTLSKSFGQMPQMTVSHIGYGAGAKEFDEIPNMLRVIIGEVSAAFKEDRIFVIETNIDDMNPQIFEYTMEKLFKEGALDAYITPIQMKKSRPAFKLTVLSDIGKLKKLCSVIFSETTSIGVRYYEVNRYKLKRETVKVDTGYGAVKVKLSKRPGNITTVSPEYDECAGIARAKNVPLKKIYEEAKKAAVALFMILGLILVNNSYADTIYTKENKELKGIILEDYADRVVMSTIDGELTIMKSDIRELYYDTEEQNFIKLGDQARTKGDFIKAFIYYDKAYKLNPNSKEAKDGIVFLQGYLFKKDMSQKEEAVKRHNEYEDRGQTSEIKSEEDIFKEKLDKLKTTAGITLTQKNNITEIANISKGLPAYEAGMRKGDVVIAVWGRLVGYMSLKEVVDMLLEKTSLETKCTVQRGINVTISANRNILSNTTDLIGVTLAMQFDGLTISSVKENSGAFVAGLKQNDIIVEINDNSTRYMPLKRAVEIIKKSKGDTVELTIRREIVLWGKGG